MNKVLTVLASLCGEMETLKIEAEQHFYHALLYYGEGGWSNQAAIFAFLH
jgi:hypothetical protein